MLLLYPKQSVHLLRNPAAKTSAPILNRILLLRCCVTFHHLICMLIAAAVRRGPARQLNYLFPLVFLFLPSFFLKSSMAESYMMTF